MAYVVEDKEKKIVTWDDNPTPGGTSEAVIIDQQLTELQITDPNGVNAVFSINMDYLLHLRNVINDLETLLIAP